MFKIYRLIKRTDFQRLMIRLRKIIKIFEKHFLQKKDDIYFNDEIDHEFILMMEE